MVHSCIVSSDSQSTCVAPWIGCSQSQLPFAILLELQANGMCDSADAGTFSQHRYVSGPLERIRGCGLCYGTALQCIGVAVIAECRT